MISGGGPMRGQQRNPLAIDRPGREEAMNRHGQEVPFSKDVERQGFRAAGPAGCTRPVWPSISAARVPNVSPKTPQEILPRKDDPAVAQTYGMSTRIRDLTEELFDDWQSFTHDNHIDEHEMGRISEKIGRLLPKVAHLDDAVRLSTSLLKVTVVGDKIPSRIREYERMHGPIEIQAYQRTKKRHLHGNGDDAA